MLDQNEGAGGRSKGLIVRGGVVLTMEAEQPIIKDGGVVVQGTGIVTVGRYADLAKQYPAARVLGSEQDWILPGLVNAHCHAGMVAGSFGQGIVDLPLERWLIWLNNSHLVEGQMAVAYLNTLNQNVQLIRSGVTCTADFYYGDGSEPYLGAEHGLQAYQESGMRVAFVVSALDEPAVDNGNLEMFFHLMPDDLAERARALGPIKYNVSRERYLAAWERIHRDFDDPKGTINVLIGADGPTRCTRELLASLKAIAQERGTGIQMHLLETRYQRLHGRREKAMPLVQYLYELGFVGAEVSFAHGVWLTDEEMDLLADAGASVIHNPSANLRLFDGIAPAREMLARGVNVGLGTDNFGFSDDNDFIEEIRLAALLQRVPGIEGQAVSGQTVLEMATINGARALGLEDRIGSLRPGKRADLISVSSKRMLAPFMNPMHEPQEILWRRARREDVCNVVINGRVVMENGQLTTVDAAGTEERLRAWYGKISEERGEQEQAISELLAEADPIVTEFFRQYDDEALDTNYVYNTR